MGDLAAGTSSLSRRAPGVRFQGNCVQRVPDKHSGSVFRLIAASLRYTALRNFASSLFALPRVVSNGK